MNDHKELNLQLFIDHWKSGKTKNDSVSHNKTFWDERAGFWEKTVIKGETDLDIINYIEKLLLDEGMLFKGAEVIDIGCGPGKFVASFAKTAGHVTALDFSDNMLIYAKENAKKAGRDNISFVSAPFQDIDPKEMGWEKKFDLVFSSLCPIVGNYESMLKISAMSKAYCFNRMYAYRKNELLDNMRRALMGYEWETSINTNSIICTYAVIALMGYYPRVVYMDTDSSYAHTLDDTSAREYAALLDRSKEPDAEMMKKVQAYLETVTVDGVFTENIRTKSALIWWNVNEKE